MQCWDSEASCSALPPWPKTTTRSAINLQTFATGFAVDRAVVSEGRHTIMLTQAMHAIDLVPVREFRLILQSIHELHLTVRAEATIYPALI